MTDGEDGLLAMTAQISRSCVELEHAEPEGARRRVLEFHCGGAESSAFRTANATSNCRFCNVLVDHIENRRKSGRDQQLALADHV